MARLPGKIDFTQFYDLLTGPERARFDAACERKWVTGGEVILQEREASDCVLVIDDGTVEVIIDSPGVRDPAPLAYLGKGDILGEMGVLNRQPRSATVRAVGDVHYRRIEAAVFLDLVETLPGLGLFLSYLLAERLAHTTSNTVYNSFCVDLSGKLPSFDLLAVLQTIDASRVPGRLKLFGAGKEELGTLFIRDGMVTHAQFRHLMGLQAFKQLLLEPAMEGAFNFIKGEEAPWDLAAESRVDQSLGALLLESAVERDEVEQLPEDFRRMEGLIARTSDQVDPSVVHDSGLQVLQLIEREPLPLHAVWSRLNLSTLDLARVCGRLADLGLLVRL